MALLRFRFTPKYTLSYTHTKSVCLSASCTQWFSHISFILRKNCLWDQLADIEVVVLDGGAWIAELYHTRLWISVHWAMPWGCEFEPQWWQTLFWTQAQHLHFFHDSIWFIWFDTIIWLSNLSFELWNRKLKLNKIYSKIKSSGAWCWRRWRSPCLPSTWTFGVRIPVMSVRSCIK